ncbi:MAG: hypothetical protein H7836_06525 [Magnetococcus sp. YQC-3]
MTDSSTIRRDNPLFIRYGSLVERCFAANAPVGAPLSLFPAVGRSVHEEGRGSRKGLEGHADPGEVAAAQKTVDKLRAALLAEAQGHDEKSRREQPVTRQLHDFRVGLQQGKEVMLEENPFYELTGLFYRINLTAMKNGFSATQREVAGNPPRPITVSRSYRHIWSSDNSVTSLGQKWWETIGKVGSLGKLLVGLLLFAGSTVTTAKGVVDLVQLPEFINIFGDRLAGGANESLRISFSLWVGFALSSIILDYKRHLFLGAAESGRVFHGFYKAWRRHPRWVIIAAFLTMVSIWTNYDGIVLLTTKTEDLAHQWRSIEQQVSSAMGDARKQDTEHPGSLRDLHAALHKKADAAIVRFKKVPEDEISGIASSGMASAGPRYFAKRFIIEGSYAPGRNDVARVYKNTPLAGQIDIMLRRSGLDLSLPLEEKIKRILAEYDLAFRQSEAAVQEKMAALSSKMTFRDYSLEELTTMFNLESYHINEGVQGIVAHLEENKYAFARAAQAINQLAESHIALLRDVDKVGIPTNNNYSIEINIGIPRLDAIDRLKQGGIPLAKRRNLVELKEIMLERYGMFLGGTFLFLILFMAIFMDLSDPILYSAMVARWGRRDRHFLDENVKRFQEWEEEYVHNLHRFLVRSDVLALLPKLPTPKNHLFHHLYNYALEEVEPRTKDPSSRGWWERARFWFLGLFSDSRIEYVEGYNARQTALMRSLREPELYAPRLLAVVFPGLLEPVRIGVDHFDTLFEKIHARMKRNERLFERDLLRYAPASLLAEQVTATAEESSLPGWLLASGRAFQGTGLYHGLLRVRAGLYWLFWKPVDPPNPTFPLTRISQLRALALSRHKSRSHINQLADFVPSLRYFLRDRLFVIKNNLLQPLVETLTKIPNGEMLVYSFRIGELQTEYAHLEQGLVEVLGLSQFQGIQISEQMVQTIVEQSEIDEIVGIYLRRDTKINALEQRIGKLEFRLARAYKLIKDLVEGQDTLIFTLTRIRREYLSPINTALSKLQTRARIEEALGLHKMRDDLAIIENCLLELWDPSVRPIAIAQDVGSAGLGAIINLIRRNSAAGREFDLVAYVKQLEERIAHVYQQLDTAIYQLGLVDKITANTLHFLDDAVILVQDIFAKDEALQAYPLSARISEQKKFDFLEENRLFFRTVSLQVDALRARVNTLDMGDCLLGSHGMDLARDQEKQAIMLRYFLKNSLDFLEGRRDSVGLSASLAELQPRSQPSQLRRERRPEPPPVEEVTEVSEPSPAVLATEPPPAEGGMEGSVEPIVATEAVEAAAVVVAEPDAPLVASGAEPAATAAPVEDSSAAEGGGAPTATPVPEVTGTPTASPALEGSGTPMVTAAPEPARQESSLARLSADQLAERVQSICAQAKQVLLDMSLWEWDLLKKPVPPPDLLNVIQAQKPAVEKACMTVEGVLVTLEGLNQWHEGALEQVPGHLTTLQSLEKQATDALEQLHTLFDQISLPAYVDRRSKVAVTRFLKQKAAMRRTGQADSPGQPEPPSQRLEEGEGASRRTEERIAVRCRMEVQSMEGGGGHCRRYP